MADEVLEVWSGWLARIDLTTHEIPWPPRLLIRGMHKWGNRTNPTVFCTNPPGTKPTTIYPWNHLGRPLCQLISAWLVPGEKSNP